MNWNRLAFSFFLVTLSANAELVQIDAVGDFDSDATAILDGDLSYSITVVYDTDQDPVFTSQSDGCCGQPGNLTTTDEYLFESFSLTVAGQTVSLDNGYFSGDNGLRITDSTSDTSDGVGFHGSIVTNLVLNGVPQEVTISARLGSFGLGSAFSMIGPADISRVYTTALFNQDLDVYIDAALLNDADENSQNGTSISFSTVSEQFTLKQVLTTNLPGFGVPVSLDGNAALIGAAGGAGSAALLNTLNGDVLQTFDNPNPATSGAVATDFYAGSHKKTVELSSGRVLIGAESEDDAATDSGAAYLFDAGTGALLQTFTHPNPIPDFGGPGFGQGFGREIALSGDFALVASIAREAFLFDAITGNLLHTFSGPTPPALFGFGESVALSQQFVAIGDSTNNGSAGAVHLYDKSTGNFLRTFSNPTPGPFDFFGEEIALDGNRVLIGAGQVDVAGLSNAGEAYLFDAITGNLLHTFVDPTGNINALFGRHLDIEGDVVAIGAQGDNEVHIFDAISGDFLQTIAEQTVQSGFGRSVDLDRGNLLVGSPFGEAFLYGLPSAPVEVSADECTATAGGCNPTGGHEIVLPDGFVVPPGGVITQTAIPFIDPRVDENGRCDGQTPLVLFGGELVIPPYICGSPEFEVLETEANFDILEGTILSTMFPEVFVDNALDCTRPITGDPQSQDIVVWQPTDSADVIEGHALELTFDCGSSRGKTRRFSFYLVGMHIDFGVDFDQEPQAVTQGFIDLTNTKFESLLTAVNNARPALGQGDSTRLYRIALQAQALYERGNYSPSSRLLEVFLSLTERAVFDLSGGFNHEGNLLSRASNIKFTIDEKIIPFEN